MGKASEVQVKMPRRRGIKQMIEAAIDPTQFSAENTVGTTDKYVQWSVGKDGAFFPCFSTTTSIPPGVYLPSYSQDAGYFLKKQHKVLSDDLLELPIAHTKEILGDIDKFWNSREQFRKYNMVYKRGILMHGLPGMGKSYLIQNLMRKIIGLGGVVILANEAGYVQNFIDMATMIRQIEPTRPLLVIFEDIDNIVRGQRSLLSALLNVLDGVNQIDNVVYLATTNYPEDLQERISNRPSRFDRVYEIKPPSAAVRKFFIEKKIHKEDLAKIDIKQWVKLTQGFSLSHIKELIVSTMIFDKKIEDVLGHFETMKKAKTSKGTVGSIGFGAGSHDIDYEDEISFEEDDDMENSKGE